jgi:hypothetical protein
VSVDTRHIATLHSENGKQDQNKIERITGSYSLTFRGPSPARQCVLDKTSWHVHGNSNIDLRVSRERSRTNHTFALKRLRLRAIAC